MDISHNQIDLKYLMNPIFATILTGKDLKNCPTPEDLDFYKRRIFMLTKDFLQGKPTNDTNINKMFDKYAIQCIEYFKFNDKKEVIQKDYNDLKVKKEDNVLASTSNPNNFIMRKPVPKVPKITDHIHIKTTKPKKMLIIPKVRNINLKDKKYREKKK